MGGSKPESKYVLYVSNLSSDTRTKEVRYEFEKRAGKVYQCERDYKSRCALVEFDRASDASYAWRKMDGFFMDGREWKVDYAIPEDFKEFGWKWTEGGLDRDSRSRSRSPTGQDASCRRPAAGKMARLLWSMPWLPSLSGREGDLSRHVCYINAKQNAYLC
mmetsp:Transcript_7863/g.19999  ORF Transcript_7863/g.19999 Transcript_7863/m.19999 type:complete len:161 (-) Transcript_7863:178-660(-)|eukprot:jgi/Tetstr1/427242/TSEL_017429.t1